MEPAITARGSCECCAAAAGPPSVVVWLQGVTLAWMLVECAVSLYAAWDAHSVALLTFGADSFVELLSALVVLFSFVPSFALNKERAARWAGVLLFALAVVIALTAVVTLARGSAAGTSCAGIGITIAALMVMPVLAWMKRRTARATDNRALAADAVQSATCAYLAAITLAGLGVNALFHIRWVDSAAALVAIPVLVVEGQKAMRGEGCGCC
jgi:divalent metal cation (Fe/Co/Zn/Cd) transporter